MKVGRRAQHDGVNVGRGRNLVDSAHLGAILRRDGGRGLSHRVENSGKNRIIIAGDGAGMNLADAAGAKNGKTDWHGRTPVAQSTEVRFSTAFREVQLIAGLCRKIRIPAA